MNGNSINDLYIDEEERIWLANYPIGITVQNNRYSSYKWIKHSIGNRQSLINDQVNSIIEDSDGDLWFGTNNGISLLNSKTGQWRSFLSSFEKNQDSRSHIFTTLCEVLPRSCLGRRILLRHLSDRQEIFQCQLFYSGFVCI